MIRDCVDDIKAQLSARKINTDRMTSLQRSARISGDMLYRQDDNAEHHRIFALEVPRHAHFPLCFLCPCIGHDPHGCVTIVNGKVFLQLAPLPVSKVVHARPCTDSIPTRRSVTRPVRELKGFQRIALESGETRTVSFSLHTDDLAFHNRDMKLVTEPGRFHAWIGGDSDAELRTEFVIE